MVETKKYNALTKILNDNGINSLKYHFDKLYKTNKLKALNLINNEDIDFTTLYILKPKIEHSKLYKHLNKRNRLTLKLINRLITKKRVKANQSILKWLLDTGANHDGIDDKYDEILDKTALLLIRVYKDETSLPIIANMIFKRNRKGLFIYDLIWAFFECRNPDSLTLISNYLKSNNSQDVLLAKKLLSFIPNIDMYSYNNNSLYIYANKWLKENSNYLYYTGESFHQTNNPIPYILVYEAKYLYKPISSSTGKALHKLTSKEKDLLEKFSNLDEYNKLLLSQFSYQLYNQNIHLWKIWINSPVKNQIIKAKSVIGGSLYDRYIR